MGPLQRLPSRMFSLLALFQSIISSRRMAFLRAFLLHSFHILSPVDPAWTCTPHSPSPGKPQLPPLPRRTPAPPSPGVPRQRAAAFLGASRALTCTSAAQAETHHQAALQTFIFNGPWTGAGPTPKRRGPSVFQNPKRFGL